MSHSADTPLSMPAPWLDGKKIVVTGGTGFVGLNAALSALEQQLAALRAAADAHTAARIARDGVVPAMQACREHCDALERMLNAAVWPLPSYAEMLWLH